MDTVSLARVLECPDLPTLPKVAIDLIELTRDPDVDVAEIAKLVQFDQALTAKVLRTVNSSYYGLVRPCTSIRRATAYLGINPVRSIVLGFALVDLTRRAGKGLDLVDYWRRCVYSAAAARRIAVRTDQRDPEEAFIAALMQDIGMLTLHTATGQAYDDVVGSTRGDHRQLPQQEKRRFGFTHADAGAGLGARWRLPDRIIEPIRLHHSGDTRSIDDDGATAGIVHTVSLSYRLATVIVGDGGADGLRTAYGMGDRYFGLSIDDVRALLADAWGDAHTLSGLLEVKIGDNINLEQVLSDARDVIERYRPDSEETQARDLDLAASNERFLEELRGILAAATGTNGDVGLVLVELDAHPALADAPPATLDVAINEVRRRIERFAGANIQVHRTASHRLAVIVPGAARQRTTWIGTGVRTRVALAPFTLPGPVDRTAAPIRFTVSVGVACFDTATRVAFQRPEVLVAAAQRALAGAGAEGDTVEAFVPGGRAA